MCLTELIDSTYNANIAKHQYAIVMFYADNCKECEYIKPAFEQMANNLAPQQSIALFKVNAALCPIVRLQVGVYSLPLLVVYHEGKPIIKKVIEQPYMIQEVADELAVAA